MSTIKDVALRAGVSPSTVSRVLADSPRISIETKERVRSVLAELDYHPNALARGLVTRFANAIGILITPDMKEFFMNPFFAGLMQGISEIARAEGFDIILSSQGQTEAEALGALIQGRRVDGVILLRSRENDETLARLASLSVPAVLLGRPVEDVGIPYVDNDNADAAYRATKHLIELGHTRIGFLGGAADLTVTKDRVSGYQHAHLEAGLALDEKLTVSSFFLEQGGYLGMLRLLANPDRPTAILASDDVLAFGAMQAASEAGYEIPGDLAVVGFNDIRLAELANPALTTVRVHMEELGAALMELLLAQIRGEEDVPAHRVLPAELVVRLSCGAKGTTSRGHGS